MNATLYLVSNSPGEVSTFVKPVVSALRRRHPDWELQICLVPCPYATGAEAHVIAEWPEAPRVWTPWQTTKAWWNGVGQGKPGAVVFLGGDPWHALLLKHRFQMPCLAYFSEPSGWEKTRWLGGFDKVAIGYGDEAVSEQRIPVGDLRVDAVSGALELYPKSSNSKLTLALFPGSRWLHLKAILGSFLKVVDDIASDDLEVLLAASPFVSRERLADAAARPWNWGVSQVRSELRGDTLVTENGSRVQVVWGDPYRVMAQCDLALSLPGTNTAELAIAGKPTVVPLSAKAPVGGGGILGLLDRLPGLDRLKEYLKLRKKARLKLVALPNQLAGREIMPEFIVSDDLRDLSDFMTKLLKDPERRQAIGSEAREIMGPPGAALRLVEVIEELVAP
jgi:lipid-A-disaccharide synthase